MLIIQVLYEVAFAYGNLNHKFYLYTTVPRSIIHSEMSLHEVAALSSILSVECIEEAIDASVFSEKVLLHTTSCSCIFNHAKLEDTFYTVPRVFY